jgi:hypothetical protein
MKTKEIQTRLDRGYTMAIYGTRENIHEQMTNDIKELLEAINYTRCSTQLPVDRLQELIEETYTWQVQDLDADTFEESLKLGIREGALAVKHYIDDKRKAIV